MAAKARKSASPTSPKKPAAKAKPAPAAPRPLTDKQQRFVEEYLVDLNATQAAIRAGYAPKSAEQQGYQLLQIPSVRAAVDELRTKLAEQAGVTVQKWLERVWAIASADPRELVEVKVGCCRHCYGEGHRFQRTVGEMNRDREEWATKGKEPAEFDEKGGIGFDPLRPPSPDCPECGGDGHARTVLRDTRHLPKSAAILFAGAKEGKYGIEVQLHSQLDALEKIGRHLGVYEKDNKQANPGDALASLLGKISANGSRLPVVPKGSKA